MKQFFKIMFGVWLLLFNSVHGDPIITFFFQEYPLEKKALCIQDKFKKPHCIAKQTINGILHPNPTAGVFSLYFGFLNTSDYKGQTVFPRKQSKPFIRIVITNKITPMLMFNYTVSHWETVPGNPVAIYHCTQKEDQETKLIFWEVTQAAPLENHEIPFQDTLIIIAKPTNLYIPTGITLTELSANLILPTMYVKKSIQTNRNALYMLDLSLFFSPINILYKKDKRSYETLVDE